ncbi:MAG: hypothetical protein CR988_05420 [Treponema sp.]|nr:MAG: hypothetical protein CR988_05420 [Treponema sp.]
MKKLLSVFLLGVFFATSAFAIDLSAGGSLGYTQNWHYVTKQISSNKRKTTTSLGYINVDAFFDAQYIRLTFGPSFSAGYKKTKSKPANATDGFDETTPNYTNLNFGILGKYPFQVGFAKIFPLAGLEMSFNISAKYNDMELRKTAGYTKQVKNDLNHYYFVAGVGADLSIVGNFFITPTAIFGVDLRKPSNYKTTKKGITKQSGKYSNNTFLAKITLGFGYKF